MATLYCSRELAIKLGMKQITATRCAYLNFPVFDIPPYHIACDTRVHPKDLEGIYVWEIMIGKENCQE